MKMITYYADDASMGDTSEQDRYAFRVWARKQLSAAYPEFEVSVSDRPNLRIVSITGCNEKEAEEIERFASGLFENCPWDWF